MINFGELWGLMKRMDVLILLTTIGLLILGVCFIYSAHYHMGSSLWWKQIFWICVGTGVFLAACLYDYRRLKDVAYVIYGVGILLLLGLWVFGFATHSAQSWYNLGFFHFQPSEVMKPAMILALGTYLSEPMRNVRRKEPLMISLGLLSLPFFLIAAQPDLGTAMILVPIAFAMLFVCGLAWRVLGAFTLVGAAMMPLLWMFMKPHQQERILTFLDPSRDPQGAGWNMMQSKIAVASGGLTGKGFLEGTQNILGFLPNTVAPTDFIYSVISEEMGFVGSAVMLFLFGLMLIALTRIALRTKCQFGRLLTIGVLAMVFSHVTINVAMTVGLAPIVGLPLPFVSYGGSFMISMMLALGLVQSVHIRRS